MSTPIAQDELENYLLAKCTHEIGFDGTSAVALRLLRKYREALVEVVLLHTIANEAPTKQALTPNPNTAQGA